MTAADALNLLRLHRAEVKGGHPQLYGWRRSEPDIEAVRAEVMRKLEAMARKRGPSWPAGLVLRGVTRSRAGSEAVADLTSLRRATLGNPQWKGNRN